MKVTDKAKRALDIANRLSKSMHYNYVGTEHILAGLVKEGSGVAYEVLTVNGVELSKLLQMIEELISINSDTLVAERDGYSPRAQHIIAKAEEEARKLGYDKIGTEHILLAIIKEGDCAASRLLNTLGVNLQKLFTDVIGAMGEDPAKFREELAKSRNVAKNGSATPTLDQYSRDLTEMAMDGLLDPVIGRKQETQRVIQILSRRGKNNPCLIGEPGVGKTAIVEGIAESIVNGTVPGLLRGKRLVSLDMSGLVAKSKYRFSPVR